MATAATWMRIFLAPTEWLVNSVAQAFGNIVNFRTGFSSEITANADGVSVLNIDVDVADATYNADPDTIVLRNGSGAVKATTFTGDAFTYSTPVEITRDEPLRVIQELDSVSGWSLSGANPVSNVAGLQWATEIAPPAGSALTSFSVVYIPPTGHGALPTFPKVSLVTFDEDGAPSAVAGPTSDTAVDVATYETTRTLTHTLGAPITIDPQTRYAVLFEDETGGSALAGTVVTRVARWTVEVTSL